MTTAVLGIFLETQTFCAARSAAFLPSCCPEEKVDHALGPGRAFNAKGLVEEDSFLEAAASMWIDDWNVRRTFHRGSVQLHE